MNETEIRRREPVFQIYGSMAVDAILKKPGLEEGGKIFITRQLYNFMNLTDHDLMEGPSKIIVINVQNL